MIELVAVPSELEGAIVARIRLALGREPDLVLWRHSTGRSIEMSAGGVERVMRHGLPRGTSDLIGILGPAGRWFVLEIKRPGWRPKGRVEREHLAEQERFLALVRSRGGFGAIVHSVEEACAALARARIGCAE